MSIGRGTHLLTDKSTSFLKITTVVMTPAGRTVGQSSPSRNRTVKITSWNSNDRQVIVGSGPSSFLIMHQNFNNGWQARFNGVTLMPVELDGWQQAWRLPAGQAGTINIVFGPNTGYQIGLIVGLIFAIILFFLAFSRNRKQGGHDVNEREANLCLLFVIASASVFLIGGVLVVMLPIIFAVDWRFKIRGRLPWIASICFVTAGVWIVAFPGLWPGSGLGVFNRWTQFLVIASLSATISGLILWSRKRSV